MLALVLVFRCSLGMKSVRTEPLQSRKLLLEPERLPISRGEPAGHLCDCIFDRQVCLLLLELWLNVAVRVCVGRGVNGMAQLYWGRAFDAAWC